jgi:diguanylate cyclase (GGDEF)-like protein
MDADERGSRRWSQTALATAMVMASSEGMAAVAADGTVLLANPAAELLVGPLLLGRPIGRVRGLAPLEGTLQALATGGGSWVEPPALRVELARDRVVEVTVARLRPGDPAGGFLLSLREDPRARTALQDAFTGLLNRRALLAQMEMLAERGGGVVASLDIDGLKLVNDQHGHPAGDEVITHVAGVLTTMVRKPGVAARVGGDEFVILLPGMTLADAEPVLQRIRAAVRRPLPVRPTWSEQRPPAGQLQVSVSAGVAALTGGRFPDHALMRADRALHMAKSRGGDTHILDGPDVQDWAKDRTSLMTWVHDLRDENGRLRTETRTDALTGLPNPRALADAEALLADAQYPVAVLFLDLDEFGDYNHRYGDTAGDTCLKAVATTLAGGLRGQDQVFRKGGEEFVALLPGVDTRTALATGQRLRAAVQALAIEHTGNQPGVITVTVAVAATNDATSPADARERAAATVYSAKLRNERNQVHPTDP